MRRKVLVKGEWGKGYGRGRGRPRKVEMGRANEREKGNKRRKSM